MANGRHSGWFKPLIALVIAAALTLGAAIAISADLFFRTQLRLTDALFPGVGASSRVVVLAIDDESVAAVGRWPWSRTLHADLIDAMAADGAALIGYDITFGSPTLDDPAADTRLAEAMAAAGNVVLAENATFEGTPERGRLLVPTVLFTPIPELAESAAAVGHANTFPDTDGVVRALAPVIETPEGELVPSLSFALARLATGETGPITIRPDSIQSGRLVVETTGPYLLRLNFADEFETVKAVDVLNGTFSPGTFEGKVVLVGATALGLGDLVATPLDKAGRQPGVEVHANALNTMLTGATLEDAPNVVTLLSVFLIALIAAAATLFWRPWLAALAALALLVSYYPVVFSFFDGRTVWDTIYPAESLIPGIMLVVMAVSFLGLLGAAVILPSRLWHRAVVGVVGAAGIYLLLSTGSDGGVVLNMVFPPAAVPVAYVAALGVRYFTEVRERKYVTNVFGRYLAKDVVDEVLASPEGAVATLEGASRPLAVLFADLRGFTSASEKASPTAVVGALNEYLDAMTRAVVEEQGTIDKFMGDCVMAFWGAPRRDADFAVKAVRAAMKMLDYVDHAVEHGGAAILKVKGCGVGLSLGEAVVGNIGSNERLDYTAIGDTVNTASRLCDVAEGGDIVVTEALAEVLPSDEFRLADLPPLKAKGKAELIRVFQVLRPGQEPKVFAADAVVDKAGGKGEFQTPVQAQTTPEVDVAEEPAPGAE